MSERSVKVKTRPKLVTKAMPPRPQGGWNVTRMVALAGGSEALRTAHAAFGFPKLTGPQVSNWCSRHAIPSARLAELLIALQSLLGPRFDAMAYIKLERQGKAHDEK